MVLETDIEGPNYYAESANIHPAHYQSLVDRGWRRSGTTYYKPDVRNACCPHYTIRLDASTFRSTRDQRKAVNAFTDYVTGHEYRQKAARLCPKTRGEKNYRRNHWDLAQVNEPLYDKIKRPVDPTTGKPIEPAHKLEIVLEQDKFTEEKYALFAHYQRAVHKDLPSRISKSGFRTFLCSGFAASTSNINGEERLLGSYHQCYRLDGRLVAIGVLDLLPHCVSSVYLMYHESVSNWEFGKLSAMQEIALSLNKGYGFYYMGYYIHSCVKMRYKRRFYPTCLLDPESYQWDLFDEDLLQRLSSRKYVSLSYERRLGITAHSDVLDYPIEVVETKEGNGNTIWSTKMPGVMSPEAIMDQVDLSKLKVMLGNTLYNLGHLGDWDAAEMTDSRKLQGVVAEFVACVGPQLAEEIVLRLG